MFSRIRFVFKGILGSLFALACGVMLVYLSVLNWQLGEFSIRGHLIRQATEPIQFLFFTGLSSIFGLALVCGAPILLKKILKATDAEMVAMSRENPRIFGNTRPSIFWLGLFLIGGFILVAYFHF